MNKLSHSILIFCLVTVTVLASGCGAVTAVPLPTGTPIPSMTPTETATAMPSPTNTPEPIHPEGAIFYMVRDGLQSTIYSVDLKSQRIKMVLQSPNYFLSYKIVGNSIYANISSEKSNHVEIFKMNLDGSGKEQLTISPNNVIETFDADPSHRFLIYNDKYDGMQVYLRILDLQTNKSEIIAQPDQNGEYAWFFGGTWSPDGKKLLYVKTTSPNVGDVCTNFAYDVAEKKSIELLPGKQVGCVAVWSPDGKNIALRSNGSQQADVYILNFESGALKQFSIGGEDSWRLHGLTWSSDGKQLLFSTGKTIYLLDTNSGNLELISTYQNHIGISVSSPNKNMVLYELDNRTENNDLYLFDIANKATTKIYSQKNIFSFDGLSRTDWYFSSVWSPDGKYFAYFTTPEPDNYSRINLRPIFLNVYDIETGGTVSFEVPAYGDTVFITRWIYSQ